MEFENIELISQEDEHPWAGESIQYPCNTHGTHPVVIKDWLVRWVGEQSDDVQIDEGFMGSILKYFLGGAELDDMVVVEYDPIHHDDHLRLASQRMLADLRQEVSPN